MILISEDDKNNFETIFAQPDFQPAIRRKKRQREPVLEKPEILPSKRVRPCLNYVKLSNYGDINDEDFNEDDCLIQPDNPTNDIQNKTIETGIILLIN